VGLIFKRGGGFPDRSGDRENAKGVFFHTPRRSWKGKVTFSDHHKDKVLPDDFKHKNGGREKKRGFFA
jgi:hypothetical protein